MKIVRCWFGFLIVMMFCLKAVAQGYPNRPITLIIPFPPGGSTDIVGRIVAEGLSKELGQQVVVDNRGGAGGAIGAKAISDASPDGYTIGVAVPGTHSIPIALSRKLPYDAIKDFTPLSIAASNPLAVVVAPTVPANNLRELVEYARKNPGKLAYGTSGAGTAQHLVGEMLNQFAKIDILHVPYKGGSPVLNDLLGGQIQVGYVVVATVLGHVKAGKLKMLAVLDDHRYSELPNVPTNSEALPGFEAMTSWLGIFGPAHMPPALASRLTSEIQKVLRDPEVAKYLNANGMPVVGSTGEQLAARIRADVEGWTPIVKAGKITAD